MKLKIVYYIVIIVFDYEKLKDFYVNKLGFEIICENYCLECYDYKLDLWCGDIEFEIFGNCFDDLEYEIFF